MSEAQRELMRVQKYLRRGDKISTVSAVAICGALSDAYAEGRREAIEEAVELMMVGEFFTADWSPREKRCAAEALTNAAASVRQLSQEGPQR